jgi:hypothetical protein
MGLERGAVLNAAADSVGEGCGHGVASGIGEDFSPILGDHPRDSQVEDLTLFEADWAVGAFRQGTAIDVQHRDMVGFIDGLQGGAGMTVLTARLTLAVAFRGLGTVGVGRRWFAAIAAVEVQAIEQGCHKHQQHVQRRPQSGGQRRLPGQQFVDLFEGGFDGKVIDGQSEIPGLRELRLGYHGFFSAILAI